MRACHFSEVFLNDNRADKNEVEDLSPRIRVADLANPVQGRPGSGGDLTLSDPAEDLAILRRGLARIRRRRWYLWFVLIIYLPTMWTTQKITRSFNDSLPVFFIWFLVLLAVMGISASTRCPRCRNYFHVNGMTLLYLRKCLHCQLHLTADKKHDKAEKL